jgi:hypothetical protein
VQAQNLSCSIISKATVVWKVRTEHDLCDSYSALNISSSGVFVLVNASSVILKKHVRLEAWAALHVKWSLRLYDLN